MASFRKQEFSTWKDLFEAVDEYSAKTSQPFVKASCKTCERANKKVKEGQRLYPIEMEYVYYTYTCTHSGSLRPSGKGIRDTKSCKQGCKAKIHATLDRHDRTKIVIRQLNEEHNHEISKDMFERYVKQRKLNDVEKNKARELVKLNVPPKDLRREMVRLTGKRVIMQDIHNIKKTVRQTEKEAASNGNDAQMLAVELERWRGKDPGLVSDFGVDESGVLQYVFVQSSEMRQTFSNFPEHVLIDCTYCVNDRDMPLLSFLVVDGNSRSRLCGFALISNESSPMLSEIFTKFKVNNPTSCFIKTFMVDKDLNEVARLEEVFPEALCELCLFHVKKAFKKKIDSLQAPANVKLEIRLMVEKLCNAKSSHQYDELKEELLTLHQPFSQYFVDNWDSMRERWVLYARAEHVNLGDTTNNRIESYHQKLKSVITSPAPLDICVKKIMLLYECLLDETAHVNFVNVAKRAPSQFPNIQKLVTPHALKLAVSEVHKAVNYVVRRVDSVCYVSDRNDINKCHEVDGLMDCTCHTSKSLLIPCRHVIAVRRDRGEEPLDLALFHKRWHIKHNMCVVQQPSVADAGPSVSSFDWRTSAMEKKDRYGLAKPQMDRLLHILVELGEDRLRYYLDQLQVFEEKVSQCKRFVIVESEGEDGVLEGSVVDGRESEGVELDGAIDTEGRVGVLEGSVVGGSEEVGLGGSFDTVEEVVEESSVVDGRGSEEVARVGAVSVAEVVEEDSVVDGRGSEEVARVGAVSVAEVVEEDSVVDGRGSEEVARVGAVSVAEVVEEDSVVDGRGSEEGQVNDGVGLARVDGSSRVVEVGVSLLDIRPPSKLGKRGRPKGFGSTVLGLPKKRRILKDKCNECRQDDPLRQLSGGPTEWTGCVKCVRWFHNVCIKMPVSDSYVCKFCT